jgi:hypothetical protein
MASNLKVNYEWFQVLDDGLDIADIRGRVGRRVGRGQGRHGVSAPAV